MKKLLGFLLVVGIAGAAVYYFFPCFFVEVPTERMANDAVAKLVAKQSPVIGIDLFQKVDGQERTDESGVRHYALDYKCVAQFKKNTMWDFVGGAFRTADPLNEDASRKERKAAAAILAGKQAAKPGDTVMVKGTVEFEKKESGWVVSTVTIDLDR